MQRSALPGLGRALAIDVPRRAVGVGIEAVWAAAHFVMYPLGLLSGPAARATRRYDLGGLSPVQRGLVHHDVATAETPILLVHGIVDNHAIFTLLHRALRRRGFATVSFYDYGLLTRDVAAAAKLLGEAIEKLVANTGYERVHVIGHSLGGLIARYYVQRHGGDTRVHTLVTLGTPHQGTELARTLRMLPLLDQLTPDSPLIRELAEPAPGCRTRFVVFYSDIDHVVRPSRNARLDHPDLQVRNIPVSGVGHLSMPNNGQVAFRIASALAELDPFETRRTRPRTTLRSGENDLS
jgi:pimeloyl-ACP methyl ester carboxylesterase